MPEWRRHDSPRTADKIQLTRPCSQAAVLLLWLGYTQHQRSFAAQPLQLHLQPDTARLTRVTEESQVV